MKMGREWDGDGDATIEFIGGAVSSPQLQPPLHFGFAPTKIVKSAVFFRQ